MGVLFRKAGLSGRRRETVPEALLLRRDSSKDVGISQPMEGYYDN
jgi:hypothetical protein